MFNYCVYLFRQADLLYSRWVAVVLPLVSDRQKQGRLWGGQEKAKQARQIGCSKRHAGREIADA